MLDFLGLIPKFFQRPLWFTRNCIKYRRVKRKRIA
jgi:hypothetical protein